MKNILGFFLLFLSTTALAGTDVQIGSLELTDSRTDQAASATEEIRIALYKGGALYIPMLRGDAYKGEELAALEDVSTNKRSVTLSAKSSNSKIQLETGAGDQVVLLSGAIAEELFQYMEKALQNGVDFKREPVLGGDLISGAFVQCRATSVTSCRLKIVRDGAGGV